jgi:putative transposase
MARVVGNYPAIKTFSARRINELRWTSSIPVWQRNYYEHIIRNDNDYLRIAEYITNNPTHWDMDENNPTCANVMMQE